MMGNGLAGSGAGSDLPSPRVAQWPGAGWRVWTGSHCHTGRVVPKAVDHNKLCRGRHGCSVAVFPNELMAHAGPECLFQTHAKHLDGYSVEA